MNRGQFNRAGLLTGGALLLGRITSRLQSLETPGAQSLPSMPGPDDSGIDHIVAVTMENRSFFEHVLPPRAQAANQVDPDIVNGKTLLGMRVPVVVASSWSTGDPKNPTICSLVFDHTSVLKLIEWRWGLQPLTPRDASGDFNNLAYALDFIHSQTAVPTLPDPHTPFIVAPCFGDLLGGLFSSDTARPSGTPLSPVRALSSSERKTVVWNQLRSMAQNNGFVVQ